MSVVVATLPCGFTKAARPGNTFGAPLSIRGFLRSIRILGGVWEQELLAPFLKDHSDAISFTAYEELEGFDAA